MVMKIDDLFSLLRPKKALVIGDLMLDVYTRGTVQRISPEAPVPVLCVEEERALPGGAGNAICNLVSLGMQVVAVGRVGDDHAGFEFLDLMKKESVNVRGIFKEKGFKTPLKKRMIADYQQLLRVDYEDPIPLNPTLEAEIIYYLEELLEDVSVVAISDYAKGFLTDKLLKTTIELSKQKNIPVIVDPKGSNFRKYSGATMIKPNLGEAIAASRLDRKTPLEKVAEIILQECAVSMLMITRSKEGISLFLEKERFDFPAFVHEVKDVTGAGDTVLAIIAATFANELDLKTGAFLANVAAGIAIERSGCARITLKELEDRLESLYARV